MSFVSKVCDFLPDPADQLCTHFMNTYGPKALSELASLINPNKICTTLHLCEPSSFLHVLLLNKFYGSDFVKQWNMSFLQDLLSDKVFLNGLKTSLNASVVGSNQTCQWCKTVLEEVKGFLSDPTTQVSNVDIHSLGLNAELEFVPLKIGILDSNLELYLVSVNFINVINFPHLILSISQLCIISQKLLQVRVPLRVLWGCPVATVTGVLSMK